MEEDDDGEDEEGPSGDPALDQLRALVRETGSDALFPPLDGTALYATLCKINHSCVPNVLVSYTCTREHGLVAMLHAVRPVAAGDELVQSYVDQHAGASRANLSSFHHFIPQLSPFPSSSQFRYARPGNEEESPRGIRFLLHVSQMQPRSDLKLSKKIVYKMYFKRAG
jgi:hypothetical protein